MKLYKNTAHETIMYIAIPEGTTVTVHPGQYVQGDFDHLLHFLTKLKVVTDTDEIDNIDPRDIQYRGKEK